ncbi:angiopoietin-2-like [Drosophila sulfurigaster albostrigata]|uniref:angiopoietin-2-like n=1 Tax=Drosophila sulfurigaster albostrigata TaxID=89887 RepID=UPI002D21C885|nr:angiopoietin-2-like [Drosophila sulfurigaster albostrigata]
MTTIFNGNLKDEDDFETSSIKNKMDKLEEVISTCDDQISANEESIKEKDNQIAILESKIKSNDIQLKENIALIEESKSQIGSQESTIRRLEQTIADLNLKLKQREIKKQLTQSEKVIRIYIPYGTTARLMQVPGIEPFEPTLDDKIAGNGWIVIQRRFDGSVDFDRDLATYHKGFGDPHGEFWLGLERMHRITVHQRHELYIHIVDYENETHYARYDKFLIGSKDEEYQLKSLGIYFGDAGDMMRMSEKVNFWVCPKYKNGWWDLKKSNPNCNLNGKYSNTQVNDWHYLYWGLGKWGKGRNHIKSVQMLIRPKND